MFWKIIKEASLNSIDTVLQIAVIVIPIMVILRIAKELKVINKISEYFSPLIKKLYLSKEATFPLLIGLVFGLTYGAGVILQTVKEGRLKKNDPFLLNVFLGLNHAIFEDTLIFAAIGANAWILVSTRTFLAILATYILGRWITTRNKIKLVKKISKAVD